MVLLHDAAARAERDDVDGVVRGDLPAGERPEDADRAAGAREALARLRAQEIQRPDLSATISENFPAIRHNIFYIDIMFLTMKDKYFLNVYLKSTSPALRKFVRNGFANGG